jgi:hypothetical protein
MMQSIDESVGQIAVSELDVDERYGRVRLSDQAFTRLSILFSTVIGARRATRP